MNLRCRIFGHKTIRGSIETYGEAFRCQRCNMQVIYPENDIMQKTLRSRADNTEITGYTMSRLPDSENDTEKIFEEAKRFKRAADVIDGNLPADFGELTFSVTGEEGRELDPTQELGVYIDGHLVDMTVVDMMWKPIDRSGENVLIDVTAESDKARELKKKQVNQRNDRLR